MIGFLVVVACLGLAVMITLLEGREPRFLDLLVFLGLLLAVAVVVAYVVVPRAIKPRRVWVGGDFLQVEGMPPSGYASMARYDEIARVRIDRSKGRIMGATIVARSGPVLIRRIKDPAVVIRAILDRAPQKVKWRRTWRPLTRLKRDKVKKMLDQAGAPDLDSLLPPDKTYSSAEEWLSRKQPVGPELGRTGWWNRWFGAKVYKQQFMSPELPTAASLYVGFMLRQMFEDGSTTHVLKRSESLRTLTLKSETATPPPLDDVLDRLKHMCGIDPARSAAPADGTINTNMVASSGQPQPCKFHCRFDDNSDACCEIRLESS